VVKKIKKKPAKKKSSVLSDIGSGVSRYNQLATLFRRHISTGQWRIGEQIPTIQELAASHGVATATVRQALSILAGEKLIDRFRAKGTFVIHHPEEKLWCEVRTDWQGLLRTRQGSSIETLSEIKGRRPPLVPDFAGTVGHSYRHLRRRHWHNGQPFLLSEMFIEESLFARVPRNSLASKTGLQFISEIPGLKLADFRQMITIGTADVETAAKLELDMNAPVAVVRRYATDTANRLVFSGESIYRGDVFLISMRVNPE
jgi:GntR family transcriptional regulator